MFFAEAKDISSLRCGNDHGIGQFFTIKLNSSGGDKLFTELAVGFFQVEGCLESVRGKGDDIGVSWNVS